MSHRAKGCQGYAKRIMKAEAKVVQKKRREKRQGKARQGEPKPKQGSAQSRGKMVAGPGIRDSRVETQALNLSELKQKAQAAASCPHRAFLGRS